MLIPARICEQLEASGWPIRSAELTGTQGTRSETYAVELKSGWGILKLYNQRGGLPSEKCEREWLSLGEYAAMPHIPGRLARSPDSWILMEQMPGDTLRAQWDHRDGPARRRICVDLGTTYGRFALAPQRADMHARVRASRPFAWLDTLDATFLEIERQLRSQERFASPAFALAAERLRILAGAGSHRLVLFKADCKTSNPLIDGDAVTGIIDWEQACIVDRWTLIGIVLDHTHFLDWPAVRKGIEEVVGAWSRDDEEIVLAAGFLCMWRKLLCMQPGTHWYAQTATQEARLHAIAQAMGQPNALRS